VVVEVLMISIARTKTLLWIKTLLWLSYDPGSAMGDLVGPRWDGEISESSGDAGGDDVAMTDGAIRMSPCRCTC